MDIKLTLLLENNIVVNSVNLSVASLLKQVLEEYDKDLYDTLYSNKHLKTYTYSLQFKSLKTIDEYYVVESNMMYVYISDTNKEHLFRLLQALLKAKSKKIKVSMKHNAFYLIDVNISEILKTNGRNEVIVKMVSPLVVRKKFDGIDHYYSSEDEGFSEVLNDEVNYFLEVNNEKKVKLEPIKTRKTVVNTYRHKALATLGFFKIEGSSKSIDLLLASGIGVRRACGFGKIIIAK